MIIIERPGSVCVKWIAPARGRSVWWATPQLRHCTTVKFVRTENRMTTRGGATMIKNFETIPVAVAATAGTSASVLAG